MKKISILLCVLISILMIGCGNTTVDINEGEAISINKKGEVTQYIKESFSEGYYDINELNNMIMDEINVFNSNNGELVTLTKAQLSESDNKLTDVVIEYKCASGYADFNNLTLLIGKIDEIPGGYITDITLSDINDATKSIKLTDKDGLKNKNILISDIDDVIYLPSKVLYVSDNCSVISDNKAVKKKADQNGLIYVVY